MPYREMPYPMVREGHTCTVDLYVKIRNSYRLFAARGARFTKDHCSLLSKSRVTFYIRVADNESADEYLNAYLRDLMVDPLVEPQAKADIVYSSSMRSIRQVFQGLNRQSIRDLEQTSDVVVRMILADMRVMNELVRITSHDHATYQHCARVGIYATSLAVQLAGGRDNGHDLAAMCTAFFLHDIGMTRVPRKIVEKEGPLTESEMNTYRKHPVWGHDKLMNANYLTGQAASVVLFHHERCNGTGYPFRKSARDIPLYAKICGLADTFETLTSASPHGKGMSPFDALAFMQREMPGAFDPELFKAFVIMLGPG